MVPGEKGECNNVAVTVRRAEGYAARLNGKRWRFPRKGTEWGYDCGGDNNNIINIQHQDSRATMKSSMLLHVYESFDWSWRRPTRVILPSAFVSRILIGKGCNLRACLQGYTTHLAFRYQSYDQMMPIGDRYSHPCSHPIFAPYDKFRIGCAKDLAASGKASVNSSRPSKFCDSTCPVAESPALCNWAKPCSQFPCELDVFCFFVVDPQITMSSSGCRSNCLSGPTLARHCHAVTLQRYH